MDKLVVLSEVTPKLAINDSKYRFWVLVKKAPWKQAAQALREKAKVAATLLQPYGRQVFF